MNDIICEYCGRKFNKLNVKNCHRHYCELNPNRKDSWNKGLSKETDDRIKKISDTYHKHFNEGKFKGTFTGRKHTEESKLKISIKLKGNHHNDVNKTGKGKKGWYKGFFCSSTYELAYIIYCLDHNIDIKRNEEYFIYEYEGKQHRYYPDFIVNNELVEIKGYHTDLVDIKLKCVNKPIKILYYNDMKYIFDYIEEQYGYKITTYKNKLYELYENK